ncbi:MAG: FkbM family methyltransferase [Flavobacteriaceae bacterium]
MHLNFKKFFLFFIPFNKKKYSKVNVSSRTLLSRLFSPDSQIIIFDVGAHRGQSAKRFRKLFKNAKIFSFEPFPAAFNQLKLLKIDNFRAFNFGFSDRTEMRNFCVNKGSQTNSLLPLNKSAKAVWGGNDALTEVARITCEFRKVDEFCKVNSIDSIDFLKIDVQGAEFKVLQGAHELLHEKKIQVIQIEVIVGDTYEGQKPLSYYFQLFESYGYKLKMICDLVEIDGNLVQADLFFTSV